MANLVNREVFCLYIFIWRLARNNLGIPWWCTWLWAKKRENTTICKLHVLRRGLQLTRRGRRLADHLGIGVSLSLSAKSSSN